MGVSFPIYGNNFIWLGNSIRSSVAGSPACSWREDLLGISGYPKRSPAPNLSTERQATKLWSAIPLNGVRRVTFETLDSLKQPEANTTDDKS